MKFTRQLKKLWAISRFPTYSIDMGGVMGDDTKEELGVIRPIDDINLATVRDRGKDRRQRGKKNERRKSERREDYRKNDGTVEE